ncbi:MAG: 3-deoxy-D-manno-octulosonate 8-phosphate phosphatase [Flavobacteriales bacterium]|nr:3-deoxy-D-manno-octulosonate 8-phosphate phosphatase [Flavobacteriales bacterium]|tara:strand:- start:6549 stop:7073 length:525 start_codon:yes stop_codon:yes gene_type:complete
MKINYKEKFQNINSFIFDVDGVLTNGGLYIFPDGNFVRKMNAKDGFALKLALKKGYNIAVITGGREKNIKERLEKLGITNIYLNAHNKLPILNKYLSDNKIDPNTTLYMGDDIPDLKPMKNIGLACCPNDAVYEIKEISHYISNINGGNGCVRDVIEQVLKVNNDWDYEDGMQY